MQWKRVLKKLKIHSCNNLVPQKSKSRTLLSYPLIMNNAFVNTAVFNLHKKNIFLDLLKQSLDNLWRKKNPSSSANYNQPIRERRGRVLGYVPLLPDVTLRGFFVKSEFFLVWSFTTNKYKLYVISSMNSKRPESAPHAQ